VTEYKLRTIKDIFDLVPAARVDVCMRDLTTLMIQSRAMSELLTAAVGISETVSAWKFPEEIVWRDDGEGEVQMSFKLGTKVLTVKTRHSKEEAKL
jgi:hypothetical protein